MLSILRPAVVLFAMLTLLTGAAYPALVTVLAQALFPHQARGSLVVDAGGAVVGSELIGQSFSGPEWFWSRPSATAPMPYHAAGSGGANQAATNPALVDAFRARIQALRAADPGNPMPIPQDLVTSSASGLDPHVSPEAAHWQADRVARARGLPAVEVHALVERHVEPSPLGLLGRPRVNVLALNRALSGPK